MAVSIEEALASWLTNDTVVGPLVQRTNADGSKGYQVYKESIPENASIDAGNAFVAIAYKVDDDTRERSLSGVCGDLNARVMLTLEAMTEAQLAALYVAIRGSPTTPKLDGMTAQYLGTSPNRVWCQYAKVEDRPDDFVPSPHNADIGTFLTHLAVRIAYWSP